MIYSLKELKYFIKSDLYRYLSNNSFRSFCRAWFIQGFRFTFFFRIGQWALNKNHFIYVVNRLILRHYQLLYGIVIDPSTQIGRGLYIGHWGGIVVNPNSVIGENCNLSPGVLLGQNWSQEKGKFGYPRIGSQVFLGNGCKIIGDVVVGDNVLVGVGAVVVDNVPDNSIVVGGPAKIVSQNGSSCWVGSIC